MVKTIFDRTRTATVRSLLNVTRRVTMIKPWRWLPYVELNKDPWYWSFGVEPYVDWAPGFHFDGFGVWLKFGSWTLDLGIRDNN